MKAMKKSITLALALVMLLCCMVSPVSAANHPFTDVGDGSWYSEYVQFVYDHGLMNGVETTVFSPDQEMDRAMLVTVLYRMDGSKEVSGSTPFTDARADGYYYNAMIWAYQSGIIKGTSETQFSPETPITREMMVAIFYRYAQYIDRDVSELDGLSAYTDAAKIAAYAKTPFQWAVAAGIIEGVTTTTLNPLGTTTRAQCAAVLERFCEWAEAVHTHSYSVTSESAATCTKAGSKTYTCSKCSDSYTESIAAVGHSYSVTSESAATCTASGTKAYTCSCGDSYTESIPATGHSYTSKVTKSATCTASGTKTYTCSKCSDSYTESIAAVGHSYSVTSESAATCTKAGSKTYTCSRCSDSYTESTGTADHSWVHHHTDEVGHNEAYYVCHCGGWSFPVDDDPGPSFEAHKDQVRAETGTSAGHSYYDTWVWVVDSPASDKWVCSGCGKETTTKP